MTAVDRRDFVAGAAMLAIGGPAMAAFQGEGSMFGLIGKMRAVSGERDALIALLLEGTQAMPGCYSYIVAKDSAEADAIWITEIWDSRDSHRASLQLPSVRATIARARPLIASFESGTETEPVGGVGLPR
jgi:quinol monooxygenase YgiN